MAWTVATTKKTVVGDMRCHIISMTADAATQSVDTGLDQIYGFCVGAQSFSTAAVKIFPNTGAGGTATAGWLGCSGFVNGDVMTVIVYGR